MVKKGVPKLGDEVMEDPSEPMIPNTTPSGLVIPDEPPLTPDPNVVKDPEPPPTYPHVTLESGGYAAVEPTTEPRAFRVYGLLGAAYEHCGELPDGTWTYRKT